MKTMTKSTADDVSVQNRQELKAVLRRLQEATPDQLDSVKKEARKYFANLDPRELVLAEQELIDEGVGHDEMNHLCDVHLELIKEQLGESGVEMDLPASHPISIAQDEHKEIKKNLKCLEETLAELKALDSFDSAAGPIDTMKELAHFFLETEKHHKREEEALFPYLVQHGITEPPRIFTEDHVEFLAKKAAMRDLVMATERGSYAQFMEELSEIAGFLLDNLEDHIYKEDNILYPIALQVLTEDEWKAVRKKFDAIGYCCFAPADLQEK